MSLDLNNVYASGAQFVRFRLNNGWDYVWVTWHDQKGLLTITSSYGNWSYIWSAMGEGTTLKDFVIRANNDYLASKLFGRKDQYVFDADDALKDIKADIIEERRNGGLTFGGARNLWDELIEWHEDLDSNWENDRSRFLEAFADNKILNKWCQEWWEANWGQRLSTEYLVLRDQIIPMFRSYLEGKYDGMVEKAPFSV